MHDRIVLGGWSTMAAIPGRNRLDVASSENPMQINTMCLTSGEISSRAVVVLSIATAKLGCGFGSGSMNIWPVHFTSSGDTPARRRFSDCGPDGIAGIVLCARGVLSYSTWGRAKPYFLGYYLLCVVRVGTSCPVSASLDLELGVGRLCLWTHETSNQHSCRDSCEPSLS